MKKLILLTATALFMVPAVAFAQDVVPADPQGCHGAGTVGYKNGVGDPGAQGSAIGGNGNSDGNEANGQAHTGAGRGAILQGYLATVCGVGSLAPD